MLRTLLLAICALAIVAAARVSTDTRASPSIRDLDLVVVRPDGARLSLQFAVNAPSDAAALDAALAAVTRLVPGAVILDDAEVSAQFAPWWWQWEQAEMPVPVAYNPAGAPASFRAEDVGHALAAWSEVGTSSFSFLFSGLTAAPASLNDGPNDGLNVIEWRDLDCAAGCVLGVTTKMDAHETDVVLNSDPLARLGDGTNGTVDARSVLVHEAGHMAGLEHSCPLFNCTNAQQDAVMYFQYRGERRSLREDDIAGLSALYPLVPAAAQPILLQLELAPGWALTALPPGAVEAAMERLSCVDAVYSFDGERWIAWIRGVHQSLQSLSWVDTGGAYWIHATAACSHLFVMQG